MEGAKDMCRGHFSRVLRNLGDGELSRDHSGSQFLPIKFDPKIYWCNPSPKLTETTKTPSAHSVEEAKNFRRTTINERFEKGIEDGLQ